MSASVCEFSAQKQCWKHAATHKRSLEECWCVCVDIPLPLCGCLRSRGAVYMLQHWLGQKGNDVAASESPLAARGLSRQTPWNPIHIQNTQTWKTSFDKLMFAGLSQHSNLCVPNYCVYTSASGQTAKHMVWVQLLFFQTHLSLKYALEIYLVYILFQALCEK